MRLSLTSLVLAVALMFPLVGRSDEPASQWTIDPNHDSINFKVRHIFVPIPGRFDHFTGTIRFDPQNLAGSLFDISVDTASVNTFVDQRNQHLRTADFFDTAKYPAMTFKSSRIEHISGQSYEAHGQLTIKDVTKDIALPFTYLGQKENPMAQGQQVAGFVSDFSIKLLDYHVGDGHWQQMGVLGDNADISLYFEVTRQP